MDRKRTNLGFGDELDNFDPQDWSPRHSKISNNIPKPDEAREAAQAAGFHSREPVVPKPVRTQRRRRTGRNAQFNIKTRPETIEAFYAVADGQGWGLGETLEYAVALLEREYPPRG